MAGNINKYPIDWNVTIDDMLIGSDKETGTTYNYPIQTIIDLIAVSSTSIVGVKVVEVRETSTKDFVEVINDNNTGGITFGAGELGLINVLDWKGGQWMASYLLIKNETTSITYGSLYEQLTIEECFPLRLLSEASRATGAVNTPNGLPDSFSLVLENDYEDYRIVMKSIKGGENTVITQDGDTLILDYDGAVGEVNVLNNAEANIGDIFLSAGKVDSVLKVKSLKVIGAKTENNTDHGVIKVWEKKEQSTSFSLTADSSNTTFWMTNASAAVVSIPDDLPDDFECAFYQFGTGEVKFITTGSATILGGKNTISEQYGTCWVETRPNDVTMIGISGDLIIT